MPQSFAKYHGLGNDFILLDTEASPLPTHVIRALCDRHLGIGADGILLVSPDPDADARMVVYNADGSRPEMCGNGLRCVAFHVAARVHRAPTSVALRIATDAGIKRCLVEIDPPSPEAHVQIDLGPITPPVPKTIPAPQGPLNLLSTSVGNPHAVLLNPPTDLPFHEIAPFLATHPSFPLGANVSFATPTPDGFSVRVWERGVGPTLACGTAACAVAAAAVHAGRASIGRPQTILLPGGPLSVTITAEGHAILEGPARHVFDGTLPVF
jgi:diaminopimelate epimerase